MKASNVFSPLNNAAILQNIVTKDLATLKIQESLLNAKKQGNEQLARFVDRRLIAHAGDESYHSFREPLKQNKPQTIFTLHVKRDKAKSEKGKIMHADRSILHRLIVAHAAGRKVDLASILKHELMPAPLSLAEANGNLRSGDKHILANELTSRVIAYQTYISL